MKLLIKNLLLLCFIGLPMFGVAEEMGEQESLGPRLADCGVLFGLLSQGNSQYSEGMKAFSLAANVYLTVAIPNLVQAQNQSSKSMIAFKTELPTLQKDEEAFRKKYEGCLDTLRTGEKTLRPQMDDLAKKLVPELF